MAPGNDPAVVRSAILAVVAAEGLPLASIRAVLPSLEDVYRRAVARPATGGTPRQGAAAVDVPATDDRAEGALADLDPDPELSAAPPPVRVAAPDPVEPVTLPSATTPPEDER